MRQANGIVLLLAACAAISFVAARSTRVSPTTRPMEIAEYRIVSVGSPPTPQVKVVLKAYDIEPIVQAVIARNTSIMQELYGNWTSHTGCFGTPIKRQPRLEVAEEVILLIRDTVDTNSWMENGGTVGSMRLFDMTLIIGQTQENHAEIEKRLDLLNRIILRDRHAKSTVITSEAKSR